MGPLQRSASFQRGVDRRGLIGSARALPRSLSGPTTAVFMPRMMQAYSEERASPQTFGEDQVYGRDMPGRGGGNLALPLGRGDSISLSRPPAQRMKHGRETESGRTDTQMIV